MALPLPLVPTYTQWSNSWPEWLPVKVIEVLVRVAPGEGDVSGGGKVLLLVVVVLSLLVEVVPPLELLLPTFMV